jgi:hypothetical protein
MENSKVVTPEMKTKKAAMSGWQDAFEFTQPQTNTFARNKLETSSRLRKTHNKNRIASLQHKQKISALDAPNLSAVVNAKPEIKRKAHAEVEKRVKKTIEKISEHKRKAEATKEKKLTASTTQQRGDANHKGEASADNADGGKTAIKYINPGFEHQNQEWAVDMTKYPRTGPIKKPVRTEIQKHPEWKSPIDLEQQLSPNQEGRKKAAAPMNPATPWKSPFKSPKKKSRRPKVPLVKLAPPLVDDADDEVASDKKSSVLDAAPSSSKEPTEAANVEPKKPPTSSDEASVPLVKLDPPLVEDADDEVTSDKKPSALDATPSSSKEPTEAADVEPKKPPTSSDGSGDKVKDLPEERGLSDKDVLVLASDDALLDPSEQSESSNEWEPASPFKSPSPMAPDKKPVVEPNLENKQLVLEFALDLDGGGDDSGIQVPVKVYSLDDMSSFGVPSIQSDDSYDTRMNKMMQRWVDLQGDEEESQGDEEESEGDEDRTLYNNDVDLVDNVLDHIVLAAPDLELAMQQFEDMTGIKPTPVGPLQGLGVCTAHVGLDNSRYIEILAPDKNNDGPLGDDLRALAEGTLTPYHYAIRSSEVSTLVEGYISDVLGWDPDHIAMVQALPDASLRQWDLLTIYGHGVGGIAPSYVKWKKAETHPTATIALKAKLKACMIRAPEGHAVFKLITGVDGITTGFGEPLLEVSVETPNGTITFSSHYPKGLIFPGYDDEKHRSRKYDFPGMPELLPVEGDYSDLEDEEYDENDFDFDVDDDDDEGK